MNAVAKKSKKKAKIAARANKQNGGQQANCLAKNIQKQQRKQQQQQGAGTSSDTNNLGPMNAIAPAAAATGVNMPRTRSKSRLAISAAANQISTGASVPSGTGPPEDPWDPTRELPTRGLRNLGNTCFFNAALQNVFKTRLLHEALFAQPERRKGDFVGTMNKALRRVFLELLGDGSMAAVAVGPGKLQRRTRGEQGAEQGAYSPAPLLNAVQSAHPSFKGKYQQDAHELFMRLVGTLEEEEDAYIKRQQEEAKDEEENAEQQNYDGTEDSVEDCGSGNGDGGEGEGGDCACTLADAVDEGSNTSRSSSGETSIESTANNEFWPDGESRDADDEIRTRCSADGVNGAQREVNIAVASSGQESVLLGGDQPLGEFCDDRTDPAPSESNGVFDDSMEESSVKAKGAEVGFKSAATATADQDAAALSANLVGEQRAIIRETAQSSASVENPDTRSLLPSSVVVSFSNEDNETAKNIENAVKLVDSDTHESLLPSQEVTMDAGAVLGGSSTLREEEAATARAAAEGIIDSRSKRTSSSASRGKRGSKRSRAGGFGQEDETGTDDEGQTTDEGDHDDDSSSGGEGFTTAEESVAATAAVANPAPPGGKENHNAEPDFSQQAGQKQDVGVGEDPRAKRKDKRRKAEVKKTEGVALMPARAAVVEVFGGSLCSVVTCGTCHARSFSTEPTVCLSLEIPIPKKPTVSPITRPKTVADASPTGAEKKMGLGMKRREAGVDLLGFELSAKEKRRNKREKAKLQKAELQEGSMQAIDNGRPGGAGDVVTNRSSDDMKSTASLARSGVPDEVRLCLKTIVDRACAAAAEKDGVHVKGREEPANTSLEAQMLSVQQSKTAEERSVCNATPSTVRPPAEAALREDAGLAGAAVYGDGNMGVAIEAGVAHCKDADLTVLSGRSDGPLASGDANGGVSLKLQVNSSMPTDEISDAKVFPSPQKDPSRVENESHCKRERDYYDGVEYRTGCFSNGTSEMPTEVIPGSDDNQDRADAGKDSIVEESDRKPLVLSPAACATSEAAEGSSGEAHEGRNAFGIKCFEVDDGTYKVDPQEQCQSPSCVMSNADRSAAAIDSGCVPRPEDAGVDSSTKPREDVAKKEESSAEAPKHGLLLEDVTHLFDECSPAKEEIRESDIPDIVKDCPENNKEVGDPAVEATNAAVVPSVRTDAASSAADGSPPVVAVSPLNNLLEPPARLKLDETLQRRSASADLDLYVCLDHFMAEEALIAAEGNGYDCDGCRARADKDLGTTTPSEREAPSVDAEEGGEKSQKIHKQDARKRLFMLGEPPGVLVCHLKRLQASNKIRKKVEFPVDLDMSPYFWQDPKAPLSAAATQYRLFGVVQHEGNRLNGHYVAYVREGDNWKHATDSHVRTCALQEVKNSQAYMLFYESCEKDPSTKPTTEPTAETAIAAVVIPDPVTQQEPCHRFATQDVNDEDDDDGLGLWLKDDGGCNGTTEGSEAVDNSGEGAGEGEAVRRISSVEGTLSTLPAEGGIASGGGVLPPLDEERQVLGSVADEVPSASNGSVLVSGESSVAVDSKEDAMNGVDGSKEGQNSEVISG